jgi:hypothetical protein
MRIFFAMIDAAVRASQYAQVGNYKAALEIMRSL